MLIIYVLSDRPPRDPGHPVRNRPHLDRRQHRLAEQLAIEQRLARADRVVVSHILIDLQQHTFTFACVDNRPRLCRRHCQRLLSQNAFHPARMG